MSFIARHNSGAMDRDPPLATLPDLLNEVTDTGAENRDVAVSHESGWTIGVFPNGRLVFEDVETDDEPRHLDGLDRRATLLLLTALAEGRLEYVEQAGWQPGYG